jgi:hypothetical protein
MRTFTEHIALQIAIALPRKRNTIYHWRRSLQRFSYRNTISFTFDKNHNS